MLPLNNELVLRMPKILLLEHTCKNYLTPEIWEETHLRETFYGTLIFQQSSTIYIGRHVEGHTLALQHDGQNYFLLICRSMFYSYAQMCCKRYHIIFSTFSLKFKCKICVQREVIHNFKNHILVTWPFTNLFILRKWLRVWKTKSPLFCLRYGPLIVFRRQNHITFIFRKTMTHAS